METDMAGVPAHGGRRAGTGGQPLPHSDQPRTDIAATGCPELSQNFLGRLPRRIPPRQTLWGFRIPIWGPDLLVC